MVASATYLLRCGDESAALQRFREAEALWSGPALADVRTHGMETEAQRLDDQLLGVREQAVLRARRLLSTMCGSAVPGG